MDLPIPGHCRADHGLCADADGTRAAAQLRSPLMSGPGDGIERAHEIVAHELPRPRRIPGTQGRDDRRIVAAGGLANQGQRTGMSTRAAPASRPARGDDHLEHARHEPIERGPRDRQMQGVFRFLIGDPGIGRLHVGKRRVESGEIRLGGAFDDEIDKRRFEQETRLEQFRQGELGLRGSRAGGLRIGDEGAPADLAHDQALLHQLRHRLAHRVARYTILHRERALGGQLRPGRKAPLGDRRLDARIERARLHLGSGTDADCRGRHLVLAGNGGIEQALFPLSDAARRNWGEKELGALYHAAKCAPRASVGRRLGVEGVVNWIGIGQ
ncbi:hypothetical protein CHELA1G2_20396 [Hyphomicrobiales bacterium]|nr:hypothetical protein CHELA1G2_20396 [Hyphomicrobiales bacterium]